RGFAGQGVRRRLAPARVSCAALGYRDSRPLRRLRQREINFMPTASDTIEGLVSTEYKYGFYTDVETESAPPGLNEDIIRLISSKKEEPNWMTEWRLKAYRHWLTLEEPAWPKVHYEKINYQDITYYS